MYRKALTGIILFLAFSGCAVKKKHSESSIYCNDGKDIINRTAENNLTNYGFYLQKGKLTVYGEEGKINLFFSMKYARRDTFLISLRSWNGMEAVRILIAPDTVLANDRINRELLYGSPQDLEKAGGVPIELFKLCIGDLAFYNVTAEDEIKKSKEEITVTSSLRGLEINSVIDCRLGKLKYVRIYTGVPGEYLIIRYNRFKGDTLKFPGEITIMEPKRKIKLVLKVWKYIVPWYGDIQLIPGSGYTKRPIK